MVMVIVLHSARVIVVRQGGVVVVWPRETAEQFNRLKCDQVTSYKYGELLGLQCVAIS